MLVEQADLGRAAEHEATRRRLVGRSRAVRRRGGVPSSRRRARRTAIAALGLVLATGAGIVAGKRMRSPAEVAAARRPPVASLVTAAVEERELVSNLLIRGTVRLGDATSLLLPGAVGASGAAASTVEVVTRAPVAGALVDEGDLLMEVAGRPVFVLQGAQPMYRAIVPGSQGEDVAQLQRALARLGFAPGRDDGAYDSGTQTAVAAWYASHGTSAQGPTADQLEQLRSAQTDQRAGEQQVRDAAAALAAASAGPDPVAVQEARNAVADAREALDAAHAAEGAGAATNATAKAQRDLELAQARLNAVRRPVDAVPATLAYEAATAASDAAAGRASALAVALGTSVPAGEVVFVPALPQRVQEVTVHAGEPVSGSFATLATSTLVVDGSVSRTDAPVVVAGQTVTVDASDGSRSFGGRVALVDTTPGSHGTDPQRAYVGIVPDDLAAAAVLVGANVRIAIKVGATGANVLAVPAAALTTSADGVARVTVVGPSGALSERAVSAGLAAQGFVAVTPVSPATLEAGEQVVVDRGPTPPTTT